MDPRLDLPTTMCGVPVCVGPKALPGDLTAPSGAAALVVFAHGSGSGRGSPRNRQVARALSRHGIGSLLLDLLAPAEAADVRVRFDIALLTSRVEQALDWCAARPDLARLRLGLFGASTGAAAALRASAGRPGRVGAIVLRGGRTEGAASCLKRITAPTLMIVGSADADAMASNRAAQRMLICHRRLEVVPGASNLFEEPGALESVAALAADWFDTHLARGGQR